MKREFLEEAGLEVDNWIQFCKMNGDDWDMYCFKAFSDNIFNVKTMTNEKIFIENINNINQLRTVSNLQWLIPMCLDVDKFYSNVCYIK
jgi:hypothetical protein